MSNTNFFEETGEFKSKFSSFYLQRKKISALENYKHARSFHHQNYLDLVKCCMKDGFLDSEESGFLDHMLRRYELNYLDWFHKTKWLKATMAQTTVAKKVPVQTFFDFAQMHTQNLPQKGFTPLKRRVSSIQRSA